MAVISMAQHVNIVTSQQIEERNGKQYFVHTIEKGQTVYSIAKAYDVSIDEIYYENPSAKTTLSIDEILYIPTVNKETEIRQEIRTTDFEFFYHVCAKDETFEGIADIYLQPESNIRKANPNSFAPFREGEYLKIPVEIPESIIKAEFPDGSLIPNRVNNTVEKPTTKANTVSFNPNIEVLADYRHVVIPGETTSSIANKYKVSINDLKAVNPGLSDYVEKGDRLRIPSNASFDGKKMNSDDIRVEKPNDEIKDTEISETIKNKTEQENIPLKDEFVKHRVQKKETLYKISREYGITIKELYDANPGLTDNIKIGQVIKVPKKKISTNYIIFEASEKLKLKKVAKLYGIPVSTIRNLNPRIEKYIYRGQDVKIPVGNKAVFLTEEDIEESLETSNGDEDEVYEISDDDNISKRCQKVSLGENHEIKIALMVPLFLEDLQDEDKMNKVLDGNASGFQPFMFINFVEGAMMAVDSLRKTGINISLKVYDVDKSITKTTKVLQNPDLKNADLIIGPFYNQSFSQVALFAGNFNIPIINPLSFRDQILREYKTTIKIMPCEETQINVTAEIIKQNHPNSKVFLITQTSYRNADKVILFENRLKETVTPSVKYSNQDLYNYSELVAMRDEDWLPEDLIPPYQMEGRMLDPLLLKEKLNDSTTFDNSLVRINYSTEGFDAFINTASAWRKNIVVVYASDKRDKAFVMDIINKLNEFRDSLSISLIGIPFWERLENMDFVQMDNLHTIAFESSFIDYEEDDVQDFIYKYRQTYSTDPGKYGFAGYDITMYFSEALFYYNKNFPDCLPYFQNKSLTGNMRFKKSFIDNNSFENYNWNIIKHENLQRHKIHTISQ